MPLSVLLHPSQFANVELEFDICDSQGIRSLSLGYSLRACSTASEEVRGEQIGRGADVVVLSQVEIRV